MNPLENIRIVLVSPLYGGNVGAVCRAMENCGITDLAISAPRNGVDMHEAEIRACHAKSTLAARREFNTTAEAVADCALVAGTTARQGLYRSHARTIRDWAPDLLSAAQNNRVAIIFGPEDAGFSNEELALCTHIVQIPSSDLYKSINLSHAVMICCYELFLATNQFEPAEEPSVLACSDLRERMFAMWETTLREIGFMDDQKAEHMMFGLRRILSRGELTEADMKILMGIARQSLWNARKLAERNSKED